jgi:hypothetical protein
MGVLGAKATSELSCSLTTSATGTRALLIPRRLRRDRTLQAWMAGWVGASVIGVGNAALREGVLGNLSDVRAHQVSTATLIAFLGLYMWWLQRRRPLQSTRLELQMGVAWALLTVAFEFALGLGITGDSVADLISAYNVAAGQVWALVPLWMLIGPYLIHRISTERASVTGREPKTGRRDAESGQQWLLTPT